MSTHCIGNNKEKLSTNTSGGGGGELAYVVIREDVRTFLRAFLGCSRIFGYLFGVFPDFLVSSFLVKFYFFRIIQICGY